MINKQAPLLLVVILAAPAIVFADSFPGHSKDGASNVAFSEGLADEQTSPGSSARCNFLSGIPSENGLQTSSIADASFSELEEGGSVKVKDFGVNQGASSGEDERKGRGKRHGEGGEGNGAGSGGSVPSSAISVAEPGSQPLLLFGLAGLGAFFLRRKALTNAI